VHAKQSREAKKCRENRMERRRSRAACSGLTRLFLDFRTPCTSTKGKLLPQPRQGSMMELTPLRFRHSDSCKQ
jgi:hypothetical protein